MFLVGMHAACSIDATASVDSYGLARYMNHSKENANLKGYLVVDRYQQMHVCFLAKRDIDVGEPLLIDYGERRRDVVASFPWLKK
jgi:histone-lysine N-methyltransferase SETD8